jgi:uncharacterized protein YeaO (DUF488 family)
MIQVKRVYDHPSAGDATRVLVDRLWPRGISKERAAIHFWLKEIAASEELREWFGHDPTWWEEFRRRYRAELSGKPDLLRTLMEKEREGTLTLVYAARDDARNNAIVLKELLGGGGGQRHA